MPKKPKKEESFVEFVIYDIWRGRPITRQMAVPKSKRARQRIREIEDK